jgi:prepilin-type N-terminal cleavage/methylation domain-containing protein
VSFLFLTEEGRYMASHLSTQVQRERAFTLIELLIVIAIILILIAIALPNFLEAQIRAKVTSAVSEMRSLETALRGYQVDRKISFADNFERVDFWHLPTEGYAADVEGDMLMWAQLTTPVKYCTSVPQDEFLVADQGFDSGARDPRNTVYRYYSRGWRCLASGNNHGAGYPLFPQYHCIVPSSARGRISGSPFDPDAAYVGDWIILSPGPDRFHNAGEWAMYRPYVNKDPSYMTGLHTAPNKDFVYSPTNGTVSSGDLVRYGK